MHQQADEPAAAPHTNGAPQPAQTLGLACCSEVIDFFPNLFWQTKPLRHYRRAAPRSVFLFAATPGKISRLFQGTRP
jgi:hypothetical protein